MLKMIRQNRRGTGKKDNEEEGKGQEGARGKSREERRDGIERGRDTLSRVSWLLRLVS